MKRIVLIAGFESFNAGLYRQAADLAQSQCSQLDIRVFSDRDLTSNPTEIEAALQQADVFFASLLFDYDQVLWLRERVQTIPIRLVFESALELMSLTQLGKFAIGDKPKGMPKPVKFILDKFSNGREEDKLAGYISFLKTGPKLLKFVPVQKVQDLRNWLIIYGYWNAGGTENVAALFCTIAQKYLGLTVGEIADPIETLNIGLLHPKYNGYFESPKQYLEWYRQRFNSNHPTVGILLYRKHVITNQQYIPKLIKAFEKANLIPVPIFINGVEGHVAVRDLMTTDYEQQQRDRGINATLSLSDQAVKVDAIVSTIGFPLVGGPAGSMEAGRQIEVAKRILSAKNVPYIVAAPLLIQDIHSWTRQGISGLQSVVLYVLPELDGAIDTIALGGLVGETIYLIPERVDRLTGRLNQWIKLRQTPAKQRKIAILLYGFPPGYGAVGTAALLNVPRSLIKLLQAMKEQGYEIADLPEDGETLIQAVKRSDEGDAIAISTQTLEKWLGYLLTSRVEKQWKSLSSSGIKTLGDDLVWGGVQLGNVWIGVQPPLGISGDPMRLMFERDLTPHPQYAAFYKWLQNDFGADAIVHFGMHGTVEWLPGSPLGNTGYSWSDILLGNLPNLYVYAANNPSESILAKRRGYGTLISHNVPPYGRAGLYKELVNIRDLIAEYREDPEKNYALKSAIVQKIIDIGIDADCPFAEAKQLGIAFNLENINLFSNDAFNRYLITLYEYLQVLENRLFSSGLHTLGEMPSPEMLESYLKAYFDDRIPESSIAQIAQGEDLAQWQEAVDIRNLLLQTTDELTNLLRGLNGEYIPPAPGGDLLRDGLGALPTGRNIHALDPYRMPSPAAYERGREIARKIIDQHLKEHQTYPETVAVMLWGLDAIKTKGESIGILLELVGAEPVKEGTGRIVRYELKPISEVGHPRIDVLANLSGIFRDSFVNIIELLDDLFQRAAALDEPADQNFIRKHAIALQTQGIDNPTARLFSNPAGDYGSLVNDQVVASNWESGEELGKTWQSRNVFSYGRKDKGEVRSQVLETLLKTTDRIVQEIDSVEYGLTDIQEYYANTGGLKRAAEQQKGTKVQASFVESFSKDTTPRNLEDLLRMEYRTKLLNPKWAEAMAAQGSGGAYEISQRMTALIGWSGTVDFKESWVYDQAADTYALDVEMAKRLQEANPEAFRNIVARMLEANGRGFWNPDDEKLSKLRALYEQSDSKLEGVEIASV
ncbi:MULTISPECIES: magnesium chelatase subunit H [Leptolyngbya]|uniref:magnesium chelatase subunit H n=1 Tax=Leptolyngbya TaxID=47251 RepID=UPI001685E58F|nr:magnesium chelatase subunit H [Leptolyngbya sp. FACHB-1624]MBD1858972.1 magnesium chelatase subunit H [Leptolyngbya sp. FACHB-1624]